MTIEDKNAMALLYLSNQQWEKAQVLFFENAKSNPSHQTYNNLGYYLVSEGLICKNGKVRNALKLGKKYLFKANELARSRVNTGAIICAIDYQLRCANDKESKMLLAEAFSIMEKTLEEDYSSTIEYNYLCYKHRAGSNSLKLLPRARALATLDASSENVSLYFELLRHCGLKDEGIECIKKNGDCIEPTELLMFYAKFGIYDKGYELCKSICKDYDITSDLAAAIVECCMATGNLGEILDFAYLKSNINTPIQRKLMIEKYISLRPIKVDCCYFGCATHNTKWSI